MLAGRDRAGDGSGRALARSLRRFGIDTVYMGRETSAHHIASVAAAERAHAVELCLGGSGGVLLIRELLRELDRLGCRGVSIVVHRFE